MGAEGAVEIVMRRQVEEADDPAAKKAELIDAYRQIIDVYVAARNGMIDDVIDPRETRPVICRALEMAEGKVVERPWKRNGVVPGLSPMTAASCDSARLEPARQRPPAAAARRRRGRVPGLPGGGRALTALSWKIGRRRARRLEGMLRRGLPASPERGSGASSGGVRRGLGALRSRRGLVATSSDERARACGRSPSVGVHAIAGLAGDGAPRGGRRRHRRGFACREEHLTAVRIAGTAAMLEARPRRAGPPSGCRRCPPRARSCSTAIPATTTRVAILARRGPPRRGRPARGHHGRRQRRAGEGRRSTRGAC